MATPQQTFWDRCWRDKTGKLTLFQKPNTPLIVWVVCFVVSFVLERIQWADTTARNLFDVVGFGAIFTWAWLELFKGSNYLRRLLGLVVLVVVVMNRL